MKNYWKHTHEELVVKFINSKGNEIERNRIIIQLLPAINYIARNIRQRYYSTLYVDHEKQAIADVISKLDNFDPEKGYKAFSYISNAIRFNLLDNVRMNNKHRFIDKENDYNIDDMILHSHSPINNNDIYKQKILTIIKLYINKWDKNTELIEKYYDYIDSDDYQLLTFPQYLNDQGLMYINHPQNQRDKFKHFRRCMKKNNMIKMIKNELQN